jgi:hypothetical protein
MAHPHVLRDLCALVLLWWTKSVKFFCLAVGGLSKMSNLATEPSLFWTAEGRGTTGSLSGAVIAAAIPRG